MGKIRKYRLKSTIATKRPTEEPSEEKPSTESNLPISIPPDDLFKNIKFNFDTIVKTLPDDAVSVKSFKSLKSQADAEKTLSKKDKIRLRRELLLKKLSFKSKTKNDKLRKRRKNNAIIGDTNSLHDALPSIEHLIKNKDKIDLGYKITERTKPRGIQKAKTRKKNMVQSMDIYKQILNNIVFKQNPFAAVSEHIKNVVQFENSKDTKKSVSIK